MTSWRQSAAYRRAVDKAFAPYRDWKEDVRCFWCGHIASHVDPCHIFGTQAHPSLTCEPLNIVPGHRLCHDYYDTHPTEKMDKVEQNLPGRIAELQAIIRERSNQLAVLSAGKDGE